MENKIEDRILLADKICDSLIADEQNAMEQWRTNADFLKLKDSYLPAIDVLTCVYNAEQYIAHAIESVVFQSYPNIHLVIVTDPCTDNTINIIKTYMARFPNITLVENVEHRGIIDCFNIGLKHCNNRFIARMDLDDLMHPRRFEKQMAFLNANPEIGVISCYMRIFNEKHETKDVTYRDDFDLQKITQLFFSPLSHAGSIFRAEVIKEFGYRDSYKYAEDYDLWFQIMNRFKTAVYPEFLYLYRTHSNQVTNERNMAIFRVSWAGIMANIFQAMQLRHTEDDIRFHIDNVLLPGKFDHLNEWNNYHRWMLRLINANAASNYFNQEKLKQFICHGYWQTQFSHFKHEMTFSDFRKQLFSEINTQNLFQKLKELIKFILHKK